MSVEPASRLFSTQKCNFAPAQGGHAASAVVESCAWTFFPAVNLTVPPGGALDIGGEMTTLIAELLLEPPPVELSPPPELPEPLSPPDWLPLAGESEPHPSVVPSASMANKEIGRPNVSMAWEPNTSPTGEPYDLLQSSEPFYSGEAGYSVCCLCVATERSPKTFRALPASDVSGACAERFGKGTSDASQHGRLTRSAT